MAVLHDIAKNSFFRFLAEGYERIVRIAHWVMENLTVSLALLSHSLNHSLANISVYNSDSTIPTLAILFLPVSPTSSHWQHCCQSPTTRASHTHQFSLFWCQGYTSPWTKWLPVLLAFGFCISYGIPFRISAHGSQHQRILSRLWKEDE